jgi:hypothetical protein
MMKIQWKSAAIGAVLLALVAIAYTKFVSKSVATPPAK